MQELDTSHCNRCSIESIGDDGHLFDFPSNRQFQDALGRASGFASGRERHVLGGEGEQFLVHEDHTSSEGHWTLRVVSWCSEREKVHHLSGCVLGPDLLHSESEQVQRAMQACRPL